ncbi:MAG: hydrolase [Firmicutes bacterium]|nr:hydrolase [Bacillota bacterium]
MNKFTLNRDDTLLLIIDIQERLAAVMSQRQKVVDNSLHLIELAKMFNMPIVVTEQYPKGLGPTITEIKEALPDHVLVEKVSFNCCEAAGFSGKLKEIGRRKIVMVGMETHICVLQTGLGLMQDGYDVHVVSDAVCSRTKDNWKVALGFMQNAGAVVTCTETVLFQLLGAAGTEEFKAISKRIK